MSHSHKRDESQSGVIRIEMHNEEYAGQDRGKCWENDFSKEFPIYSIDQKDGDTIVTVGPPHSDYMIYTHLMNQKMHGKSRLVSDKNVLVGILTFVEGQINGFCTIYDEWGILFYEGNFVNGYRQGKGKEYDKNGKLEYEGFYEKGKKLRRMEEMDNYWKEYDENEKLRGVYKKDREGNNDGICYFYKDNRLIKISKWENGKEIDYSGYFKLYDEPHKTWIEGYSLEGVVLNMTRLSEMEGYWKEYDNENNLISICKRNENGQYEGICYFYENDRLIKISKWENGKESDFTGYVKLYDEPHKTWIEGFYIEGKIRKLISMKRMKGYWKEYDNENDKLVHLCEIDEKGNYNGMCYSFENDRLTKISKWENGKEIDYSGYFKLYDEPHKTWIEGYSLEGVVLNMTRLSEMEGYWKEYDNENNLISICKRNENGQYEGICYFYENDRLIKISKWENGKEVSMNGSCKFYDEPHKIWYEGGYENGLRDGKCREYNVNGQLLYDGFYINGNKLIPMKKRKHYWKEIDANNQVIRICQIDKEGRYDGVSYLYNDGKIHRISEWKNGKETKVLKLFSGDRMTEMLEGKKRYSGGYIDTFESNYQREGEGEEYDIDGKTLIYRGSIKNGKRNGQGCSYKDMQVVYNGKWIDGYKERNYYLYMALAFAFMAVISTLCFMWNAFVGLFVSGFCLLYFIYLMKICCEWEMDIVYSSASIIFGICIVTSLILLSIKNELLRYVTIFVIGLFVTYIIFLIVYYCELEMNIVYSSAGLIFGICIVTSLIMLWNKNELLRYVTIFVILLFIIYIIFLIVYYCGWKMNIVYSSAGLIFGICIVTSLILLSIKNELLRYVTIFVIGLFITYIIFLRVYYCGWKMNIVYSSAGLIFGICTITNLIMLWNKSDLLKCITIVVIGLFIIYITFLVYYYYEIDLKVFFVIICGMIVLIIFIGLYMIIENTAYRKIIIINGIGLCLAIFIALTTTLWESSFKNIYGYNYILVLLTVCTIMGCIFSKEGWLSTFVGVILFSTVIDVAYMFNGKERYIFSVFSYIFGCFSLIYAFFGNIYVNIILCCICYSLMLLSLNYASDGKLFVSCLIGSESGLGFSVTACIVVSMDWATWIEVIIWIIFGFCALSSYVSLISVNAYEG